MEPQGIARAGVVLLLRTQWDRTVAYSMVAVALVLFVGGNYRLAHSPYGAEEVTYLISAGLGAFILLGLGVAVLLVADLRDQNHKLGRVDQAVRGRRLADPRSQFVGVSERQSLVDGQCRNDRSGLEIPAAVAGPCAAALAGGLALFGIGWRTASTSAQLARALDGLAVAGAGVGLSCAALGVTVVTVRRRIGPRSAEVLGRVAHRAGTGDPRVRPWDGRGAPDTAMWTAPDLRRFHRRSCPALHSKTGEPYVVSDAETALEPCLLCHQEGAPDA